MGMHKDDAGKKPFKRKPFVPSEPRPEFASLYKSLTKRKPTNECQSIFLKCLVCKQKFGSREERLVHFKEAHTTCKICGKVFKEPTSLRKHVFAVHQKRKPFECTTCGRKFSHKETLRSHMLTHNGVKTHVCPQCGKSFLRSSQLTAHIRIRHKNEKNHACPHCPYK